MRFIKKVFLIFLLIFSVYLVPTQVSAFNGPNTGLVNSSVTKAPEAFTGSISKSSGCYGDCSFLKKSANSAAPTQMLDSKGAHKAAQDAEQEDKELLEEANAHAGSLLCTANDLITGNLGTLAGLFLAFFGVYLATVARATVPGFMMLILGIAVTATPGLIMNFVVGMSGAFGNLTSAKDGAAPDGLSLIEQACQQGQSSQ